MSEGGCADWHPPHHSGGGGGGGGGLVGIGRPFMSAMAAKEDEYPTAEFAKGEEPQETAEFAILAHAVEMLSDWNAEL